MDEVVIRTRLEIMTTIDTYHMNTRNNIIYQDIENTKPVSEYLQKNYPRV